MFWNNSTFGGFSRRAQLHDDDNDDDDDDDDDKGKCKVAPVLN
jgi:hypothetical protein